MSDAASGEGGRKACGQEIVENWVEAKKAIIHPALEAGGRWVSWEGLNTPAWRWLGVLFFSIEELPLLQAL